MFILIDDEKVSLFLSEKIITKTIGPQEIKTFPGAGDALRFLRNEYIHKSSEPATVLLDLNMPVMSGWDFLDFFDQFDDELKSSIHIYIVSSSNNPVDRERALLNPNVMGFVTKPLTPFFIASTFKIAS